MFSKIRTELKKHWVLFTATILIAITSHFFIGCEPTTKSLLFPDKKVTRTELLSEIEMWLATADVRIGELDKAEAIRTFLLKQASTISQGGTINPTATIIQLFSLLATGTLAYNAGQKKTIAKPDTA